MSKRFVCVAEASAEAESWKTQTNPKGKEGGWASRIGRVEVRTPGTWEGVGSSADFGERDLSLSENGSSLKAGREIQGLPQLVLGRAGGFRTGSLAGMVEESEC